MATFGSTASSSNLVYTSGNDKYVSLAVAPSSGVAKSINHRLSLVLLGAVNMRAVIYADSGGAPGALLAVSSQVAVNTTSPTSVNFPLVGVNQIAITAGTGYWIGVHSANAGFGLFRYAGTTPGGSKGNGNIYSSGASNPFGSTTNADGVLDCYVTYDSAADGSASISGTSSMTADADVTHYPTVTISGTSSMSARAVQITQLSELDRKTYLYKVYDKDDNYLGLWNDVVSDLTYSQEINSAGSAIEVELARNSDSLFVSVDNRDIDDDQLRGTNTTDLRSVTGESKNQIGPGSNLDLNYRVDIYVFYGSQQLRDIDDGEIRTTDTGEERIANDGSPNGRRIFSGYISRYISRYGGTETTRVSLLSFGDELDNYVIRDGDSVEVPFLSDDPSDILRSILDGFNGEGGVVSYDSSSIANTNTVVSYTFKLNTTLEGVRKSLELSPSDWYWYLDMGENLIHFRERPSSPSHVFILGKHIEELNLEKYIEDITNDVYLSGGDTGGGENLFSRYQDAISQDEYRRGLQRISDNRVTLQESADIISQGELERNSEPQFRSNVTILSRVYPIENIQLGQTVAFRNFGNYVDIAVMQIVAINYEPDKVTLQLDTLLPRVSKRLEDIKRQMNLQETVNNPDTPS